MRPETSPNPAPPRTKKRWSRREASLRPNRIRPGRVAGVLSLVLWTLTLGPSLSGLTAQEEPEPTLTPLKALLTEGFSRVRGVQELPDGAVLVADQREEALYRVDFEAQQRTRLGRSGEGPGEYKAPTGLHPFRGDSLLMVDIQNGRLAILTPAGAVARTAPLFGPGVSIPQGADRNGNRYWDHVSGVRIEKRENPSAEQAPIVRYQYGSGRLDTLAYLTIPGPANPNAFPAWDDWAVGPHGRIAIVRNQDQYRVDWIDADGRSVEGTPVQEFRPLRVNGADERAVLEGTGGLRAGAVRMGSGQAQRPPAVEIPARFPPAKLGRIWITHDGRAIVERHQHLSETRPLFDVFDRTGQRTGSFHLPEGREVVGTGPSGLYVVRRDDVDFLWLELYRLPARFGPATGSDSSFARDAPFGDDAPSG